MKGVSFCMTVPFDTSTLDTGFRALLYAEETPLDFTQVELALTMHESTQARAEVNRADKKRHTEIYNKSVRYAIVVIIWTLPAINF